jgi:hypothetical protein
MGEHSMASVSYEFECDKAYGFMPDPNEHPRVGYVTAFAGLGLPQVLSPDLTVSNPLTGARMPVVGVIEKFEWAGGAGDPLVIDMYVSHENAAQLMVVLQSDLTTTKVSALDYIIVNYDQETKQWFTQAAPKGQSLSGIVPGTKNPELQVDLTPVAVEAGVDVNIYKISVQIAPGANQAYALTFANSSTKQVTKSWGVVIGSPA